MEVYIGTILKFSFDFTPKYWMVCHGQILPIKENYTLFSLLENTYGGDGITNFAIPDLRVKNDKGEYYKPGDIMSDGGHYIDSYISISGIYPSRS